MERRELIAENKLVKEELVKLQAVNESLAEKVRRISDVVVERIEKNIIELVEENRILRLDNSVLKAINESLAERVATQSELLARKADQCKK